MAAHIGLDGAPDLVRMRRGVLIAGRVLGWDVRHVVAFAEALTSRPWRRCGLSELAQVLEEYRALMDAIDARRARDSRQSAGALRHGR